MNVTMKDLILAIRRYDASPPRAHSQAGAGLARSAYFVGPDGVVRPIKTIGMLMVGVVWSETHTRQLEVLLKGLGLETFRTEHPLPSIVLATGAAQAHAFRTGAASALRDAATKTAIAFGGSDGDHHQRVEKMARGAVEFATFWRLKETAG
jgi:hypothetical protein